MLTAIDHLVIAVPDLAAAIKTYRDLGFSVVPGGRHTGVGTDNALIVFRDASYLELVGFYEPRPDHRCEFRADETLLSSGRQSPAGMNAAQ